MNRSRVPSFLTQGREDVAREGAARVQRRHFPIRVNLAQFARHPGNLIVRYRDQKRSASISVRSCLAAKPAHVRLNRLAALRALCTRRATSDRIE